MANTRKLSKQKQDEILEVLYKTAAGFKGEGAAQRFLQSLFTESEQLTIGRRIFIAQMILAGKTRFEICNEIGISPNTFTMTRSWLEQKITQYHEAQSTYRKKQREVRDKRKKRTEYSRPFTFDSLRHKYPAHFLLFNIAESLLTHTITKRIK